MGEAKRRREAAYRDGPWPGSAGRCPRCFGTYVAVERWDDKAPDAGKGKFYSAHVAICGRCGIAWEPIDESLIWDRTDPLCSFKGPCENCAFAPGSHEQRNREEWRKTIATLKAGGTFYCHKGVPIAPHSENGFNYPADRRKLRICGGYLRALRQWWKRPDDPQLCIPDTAWDDTPDPRVAPAEKESA